MSSFVSPKTWTSESDASSGLAAGYADDDLDDEDDEEFLQNMARQEAARQNPAAAQAQKQVRMRCNDC